MPYLDQNLNQPSAWESLHEAAKRRIEVDLDEVERVLEIARRTPGLSTYERELQQLSIFFQVATRHHHDQAPDELAGLVAFWERYRAAVVQRHAAVTPVELRAADKTASTSTPSASSSRTSSSTRALACCTA